jgi:SAM-dependent methyltransferase
LLDGLAVSAGERLLDIGAGTGELALRAATRGARVVAVDLAPGMVESVRERAAAAGVAVEAQVADAERLPYDDASFDVVASSFGVIFAPDQHAAADELARVCRSGGRLGLAGWAPGSGTELLYRAGASFQRRPPPGAADPFAWGRADHVTALLGDAFELRFVEGDAPQRGSSPEALWELMSNAFGPTRTLAASLPPDRRDELRDAYLEIFERYRYGSSQVRLPRLYLLTLGTRRQAPRTAVEVGRPPPPEADG